MSYYLLQSKLLFFLFLHRLHVYKLKCLLFLLYLQSLDAGLVSAGEKYLNHKLAEQQATNIDNLIKNISTSLGGLTDSIEGTLSAADLLELQDRYGLTGY